MSEGLLDSGRPLADYVREIQRYVNISREWPPCKQTEGVFKLNFSRGLFSDLITAQYDISIK
jgi:hypothetical protein